MAHDIVCAFPHIFCWTRFVLFCTVSPSNGDTDVTQEDIRDLRNAYNMFGPASLVRKLGRKWVAEFRGQGYPGTFSTKEDAIQWVRLWVREAKAAA